MLILGKSFRFFSNPPDTIEKTVPKLECLYHLYSFKSMKHPASLEIYRQWKPRYILASRHQLLKRSIFHNFFFTWSHLRQNIPTPLLYVVRKESQEDQHGRKAWPQARFPKSTSVWVSQHRTGGKGLAPPQNRNDPAPPGVTSSSPT